MAGDSNVLEVSSLSVVYKTEGDDLPVLRDINLRIEPGQVYGLVGESGSGKSTLGFSLMRYLPAEGRVTSGSIKLDSKDLTQLGKPNLRAIWGNDIALVPQDPFSSLNPSIRIGEQMSEVFRVHQQVSKKEASEMALDWIKRVRRPPKEIASKYPHELSGGQKQRVLVAMALSNKPRLLVLDEPTTSLDVTTEVVVIDLLRDLMRDEGTAALFITHNLGLVAGLTDRVAVLYAGELVEDATTQELYARPIHPYTQGLLRSVPKLRYSEIDAEFVGIAGTPPPLADLPSGCVFAPRCALSIDICHELRPPIRHLSDDHYVRCHRSAEIERGEIVLPMQRTRPLEDSAQANQPILTVSDLDVTYRGSRLGLKGLLGRRQELRAVDGVSISIGKSRTLGIVGESGSGKSSLAMAVMGLVGSSSTEMTLLGVELSQEVRRRSPQTLKSLQMVFQSQDELFSPYLRVAQILSRPLRNLLGATKEAAQARVAPLLDMVGLQKNFGRRYPRQPSGGERQRVAIAQAFAANPNLLIADEPVSALDVSVQANILNLLKQLRREHETSGVVISHDIAVVMYLADEVAVMYLGQIMQFCDSDRLLLPPYHPYTEALFSAIPVADPNHRERANRLEGDIATPLARPTGCPFHTRCPRVVGDICRDVAPPVQASPGGGQIRCHIPIEQLRTSQKTFFPKEDSLGSM